MPSTTIVVDNFIPGALVCKVSDQVYLFGAWEPYMNTAYLLQNELDRERAVEVRDCIGSELFVEQSYDPFLDRIRQDGCESDPACVVNLETWSCICQSPPTVFCPTVLSAFNRQDCAV